MRGSGGFRWVAGTTSLLLLLSCGGGEAPTAPSAVQAFAARGAASLSNPDPKATHDSLLELLQQDKKQLELARKLHHAEFEQAKRDWEVWKKALEETRKHQPGFIPELLRCEPQDYAGDAALIGPSGGTLNVGPHRLQIPAGALDHEVVITAVAPVSDLIEVDFQPEGLQFDRQAQLTLSYSQCVQPLGWGDLFIAYLGGGDQILEITPSWDNKGLKSVVGLLDHFSRYAVAW